MGFVVHCQTGRLALPKNRRVIRANVPINAFEKVSSFSLACTATTDDSNATVKPRPHHAADRRASIM